MKGFIGLFLVLFMVSGAWGMEWVHSDSGLRAVVEDNYVLGVYDADGTAVLEMTPVVPGEGSVCLSDNMCQKKDSRLVCHNFKCRLASEVETEEPEDPFGPSGECEFEVGHPDYCHACGPCDEGEGGCNRNWQCKKGLTCFKGVCADSP